MVPDGGTFFVFLDLSLILIITFVRESDEKWARVFPGKKAVTRDKDQAGNGRATR